MRKLALLLTGLAIGAPATAANWVLMTEAHNGDKFYVDAASIRHVGKYVAMWRKTDMNKVDKFGDVSSKSLLYFDCDTQMRAIKSWITYDTKGEVSGSGTETDYALEWRPVAPDTVGEDYLNLACPD